MAAKPLAKKIAEMIVADWRTGGYSQQALADKYDVSKGAVNNLCKGVDQDTAAIVTAGILYQQGLAAHDDRNVTAVTEVVDERTRHAKFFNAAALKNVSQAMASVCDSQNDYRARADTISKGREVVLGKIPDAAIQINNNGESRHLTSITITEARAPD